MTADLQIQLFYFLKVEAATELNNPADNSVAIEIKVLKAAVGWESLGRIAFCLLEESLQRHLGCYFSEFARRTCRRRRRRHHMLSFFPCSLLSSRSLPLRLRR